MWIVDINRHQRLRIVGQLVRELPQRTTPIQAINIEKETSKTMLQAVLLLPVWACRL